MLTFPNASASAPNTYSMRAKQAGRTSATIQEILFVSTLRIQGKGMINPRIIRFNVLPSLKCFTTNLSNHFPPFYLDFKYFN